MISMEFLKKGLLNGAFLLVPLMSYAQNQNLPDVSEAVSKFAASGSNNTAFLTEFPLRRASYMQLSAAKANGSFVNYNQSDNSYRLGLTTESYYRFNDRIMLYGMVSYDMDRGRHMTGSSFIPSEDLPFDLVESEDSLAGTKRLESYTLSGGVGYQLDDRFSFGASLFYQASNYAKFKDLRHQNSQMKLKAGLGAAYKPTSWLKLGASYSYLRRNEAVEFDFYGNTDSQYYTLISYGGFFGRIEAFGESGYTAESTPLFTETHGGALQIQVMPSSDITWFNEVSYCSADGRFGTGDDRDVIFSTHKGNVIGYSSKLSLQHKKDIHIVRLSFDKSNTENFENSYRASTDNMGVTQIKYYGKNKVMDRNRYTASAAYTFFKDGADVRSRYYVGADVNYRSTDMKTTLYPFYRKQTVNTWSADLYGSYNWFANKQIFTLSAQIGYGSGDGTMCEDGIYVQTSDDQKQPARRDDLLQREYDFLTSSRISGKISFGYERLILKNISGYAVAGVSPRYALNTSMKGESYFQFNITVGARF